MEPSYNNYAFKGGSHNGAVANGGGGGTTCGAASNNHSHTASSNSFASVTSQQQQQQYQIDLSLITKPTNIRTERELEVEITKICETLKDTCKIKTLVMHYFIESSDWKKRTESLRRVQEISMMFDDVVEGGVNIGGQYYLSQLSRLYQPLTAQVLDLRSISAKEAGRTIQIMAQALQNDFEQIAYKFI